MQRIARVTGEVDHVVQVEFAAVRPAVRWVARVATGNGCVQITNVFIDDLAITTWWP